MVIRSAVTLALVSVWGFLTSMSNMLSTEHLGEAAGLQFQPSSGAYHAATMEMAFWHNIDVTTAILVVLLACIWVGPIVRLFKSATVLGLAFILAAGVMLASPRPAAAFWQNTDVAETYVIMPNESAFWVPDVGDNMATQNAFQSEAYLRKDMIPSKRISIPHAKVSGSVYWGYDNYAPTGKLYVVDRTPYSREWVDGTRGSSNRDEGFKCQSAEGLDITTGVTISTFVTEENAPKFLFHYGVVPVEGNREDPQVVFRSVLYGRSLRDVMDTNVRNAVQTLVCNEIMAHPLAYDNEHAVAIMADIKKSIEPFLSEKGISLDFIGWADTFKFSEIVQNAIDRKFVAAEDAAIAQQLGPNTNVIQQLAVAEALRNRWNGQTPNSVALTFVPAGITDFLGGLLKPFVSHAAPAASASK